MAKNLKSTIKQIVSEGVEKVLNNIVVKESDYKTTELYDVLERAIKDIYPPDMRLKIKERVIAMGVNIDRNNVQQLIDKASNEIQNPKNGVAESKNIKFTTEQFKEYVLSEAKRLSEQNTSILEKGIFTKNTPILEIKRVEKGLFIKNITPGIKIDARDLIWALHDNDMTTDSHETGWLKVIDRNRDAVYGIDDYGFNKLDHLNKDGEVILPIENLKPSDFPEEND